MVQKKLRTVPGGIKKEFQPQNRLYGSLQKELKNMKKKAMKNSKQEKLKNKPKNRITELGEWRRR